MLKLVLSVAGVALVSAGGMSSTENCEGLCKQSDLKFCPDGSYLYREPFLGCEFPDCPFCSADLCCFGSGYSNGEEKITKEHCSCYEAEGACPYKCPAFQIVPDLCSCESLSDDALAKLQDPENSLCDAIIGTGLVNGECVEFSGCEKPEGVSMFNTMEECVDICHPQACIQPIKECPCGHFLPTIVTDEGCTFPECPEDLVLTNICSEAGNKCSCDFAGVEAPFGFCEAIVGYALFDGECQVMSGCDAGNLGVLFESMEECQACSSEVCPSGEAKYTCFVAPCLNAVCERFPDDESIDCMDCYTLPEDSICQPLWVKQEEKFEHCACGCADMNDDKSTNVSDVIAVIQWILSGGEPDLYVSLCGFNEADVNHDEAVNVQDALVYVNIIQKKFDHPCDWPM